MFYPIFCSHFHQVWLPRNQHLLHLLTLSFRRQQIRHLSSEWWNMPYQDYFPRMFYPIFCFHFYQVWLPRNQNFLHLTLSFRRQQIRYLLSEWWNMPHQKFRRMFYPIFCSHFHQVWLPRKLPILHLLKVSHRWQQIRHLLSEWWNMPYLYLFQRIFYPIFSYPFY